MALHDAVRAAYIHVPFCRHRCGYCNFTLIAGRDDLIDSYLNAVDRELSWLGTPRQVETLFVGGGTPTHLSPSQLRRLLAAARHWFPLVDPGELSVEANPEDVDDATMSVLAEMGVTRVSLGVQSFSAAKLARLDRDHQDDSIRRSFRMARDHATSVSLDLIFGAPGETLDTWRADLTAAMELQPDHVSTYGLTYERGTSFWTRRQKGQLTPIDENLERAMYEAAIDTLTSAGYEHYEVSSFARSGHRCRHNQVYWSGRSYFGVGPGATRFIHGRRETNHRSTTTYLKLMLTGRSPVAESETLAPNDAARERLVFGLRQLSGINPQDFTRETGFTLDELVGDAIDKYLALRLLEQTPTRLRLTRAGLMVSDSIWVDFLRC